MRTFIQGIFKDALRASGLTSEELAYQVFPKYLLEIMQGYLRVECEGTENIPKEGPVIIIANHSGYMGFDALMLGYQVYRSVKRIPRIIAHKLWFIHPEISVHAKKMGLVPATFENGLRILKKDECLLLFPEGEEGNFKPSKYRYRLRRFRRGFLRLALATGAPIVPATVIGAEETHITLSQIRWAKKIMGIIVPVPLNVIPLPAKWHIRFGKPIVFEKDPKLAENLDKVDALSKKVRAKLQKEINDQLRRRKAVFL